MFRQYRPVHRSPEIFRVPLVKQELPTLPEHLNSPSVLSGVWVTRSSVLCDVRRSLFVLLSFFFWSLCCLSFDLQFTFPVVYHLTYRVGLTLSVVYHLTYRGGLTLSVVYHLTYRVGLPLSVVYHLTYRVGKW
jgi:hypothetical protein